MKTLPLLLTSAFVAHCAQPSAPRPEAAPIRQLPWGQLNFLHTTDTHGWHGGHLQEPSFSADWGDYISFAKHLRDRADADGSDLLLIDTGDRIEGNGLYDASNPKGKYTFNILQHQEIDVICSGNHELYKDSSSNTELHETIPDFAGKYLASNIDIYDQGRGYFVPLAPRFRKFTTKNLGVRILAFGFLYDFKGNSNNTRVQQVQETVKEEWFRNAISDRDIDLFVVIGHVAIRSEEYDLIFEVIRKAHWDTPIQFFGGHTHIRDFKKYDRKSYAIESGRYMETLGFMSISGFASGEQSSTQPGFSFSRLYIDNNLYSMHYHSGKNDSTFPTELGQNVTKQITQARKEMHLDHNHGCAPKTLWMNRAKLTSDDSIFRWLGEEVIPDQLSELNQSCCPKIVISNTGAVRFDIFEGPFTVDTTYLVSPFTSGFHVVRDVEYNIAAKLLDVLNHADQVLGILELGLDSSQMISPEQLALRRAGWRSTAQQNQMQTTFMHKVTLKPGYTTRDDYGTDGDDTVHSEIQYYELPNCMQTLLDFPKGEHPAPVEKVDVVYNAFVEPWILFALQFLGSKQGKTNVEVYMPGKTLTSIIADWVEGNWPCGYNDEF